MTATTGLAPIPARVIKGLALLDRRTPGWATLLDPDRLDQESYHASVLGQLYGDSVEGCAVLGLTEAGEVAHGFWPDHPTSTSDQPCPPPREAFTVLTGYWQVAIAARRAGGDR